ncbi:MAG: type II toxin-antitoxin system Phd/YefM family antitoxin [Spirochaetaceae bacterium]|nr:MAG: type II toxin-antitoxin system Phd/YefM family antitoxin [Spirochaetaceae bacterium]
MKTLSKSAFKARALEIMRTVESTGEEVVVSDHGHPCVVVRPYSRSRDVRDVFADITGGMVLHEDPDLPSFSEWVDA